MGNSYGDLVSILPKSERRWIGTVQSIDNTRGISTVTLLSGGDVTASGTDVALGVNCLIVNGRIVQALPNLTAYNVTIT